MSIIGQIMCLMALAKNQEKRFRKDFVNQTFKIISGGPSNGNKITVLSANQLNNKIVSFTYRLNSSLAVRRGFYRVDSISFELDDSLLFLRRSKSFFYIGFEKNGIDLFNCNLVRETSNRKWVTSQPGGERANLEGADLRGAYLEGADLKGADSLINHFKKDLLYVLEHAKNEVPALKQKLLAGEVHGTQYEGECCCLIGTLSKQAYQSADGFCESHIPYYVKGLHNPSEQLFWQIRKGDTPENNQFAKIALEVIDEVLKVKND